MFSSFSNRLTELSHHYIDWSRVGIFLRSGQHHYSKEEIIQRGKIIATTAVFSFIGNYCNNPEKTHLSNASVAFALGCIGFTIAHGATMFPLVLKRIKISRECHELIKKINDGMVNLSECQQNSIRTEIKSILDLSLSDHQRANATQTWGRRLILLQALEKRVDGDCQQKTLRLG
jgi:hypothetical protein